MPAPAVPIAQQIAEVVREIRMRGLNVGRTLRAEKLTEAQDAYAMECLRAVLATLIAVRDGTLPPRP